MDVVAIGRAGVDLYSLDYGRPISEVRRFAKYVGGTAANTVVGLARLGLRSALVTRVSDDELGSFIRDFLEDEGVDVSHVVKDPRRKSGVVFAEISPGRDGKFLFYRENAGDLFVRKSDVPKSLLSQTRALLVTGTGLTKEPSYGTVAHAASIAKALGKMVVLNLDWRPPLWTVPVVQRVDRYRRLMAAADVVIGNQREFMAATGQASLGRAVARIPGADAKLLVITNAEKSSEVRSGGAVEKAEGFKVPLLKGLGGGDGFIAGFLYGHLKGWDAGASATFGNAVGAMVVTGHACSESMPTHRQAEAFLNRNGYAFKEATGPFKR